MESEKKYWTAICWHGKWIPSKRKLTEHEQMELFKNRLDIDLLDDFNLAMSYMAIYGTMSFPTKKQMLETVEEMNHRKVYEWGNEESESFRY